ncbi:MAG: glycosyltransferase family 4 protein [Verrucomicrobia bacterium]|nr:glycosyltransferase family 4 protein [Verrucomicrobiota bacterium]
MRLAFIVSHPVQYYVPLYRLLTARGDVTVRVFYTWHGGGREVMDRGFQKPVAWDIPLTDGYEFETVPNTAKDPGTHHFGGLRNPELVARVRAWKPDAVHLTGYAWASHLRALRALARSRVPVFFRGDSHLLDPQGGWKWLAKRIFLRRVFAWPAAFLCVGRNNRDYYRAFGVPERKLFSCPHSIETARFAEPDAALEAEAKAWRASLGIGPEQRVLLFAGKFEPKKRPLDLMNAVRDFPDPRLVLVLVGDGELGGEVRRLAAERPERFRVVPFQNQTRMPVVYRLGDVFTIPSAHGETWGLAVNEALACGRPVLVSDRVGCAADVMRPGENGEVFRWNDWGDFAAKLRPGLAGGWAMDRAALRRDAERFAIAATAESLMQAIKQSSANAQ